MLETVSNASFFGISQTAIWKKCVFECPQIRQLIKCGHIRTPKGWCSWRPTKCLVAIWASRFIFCIVILLTYQTTCLGVVSWVSKEQGKRVHQDVKVIEERYEGQWDEHIWWLTIVESIKRGRTFQKKSYKLKFTS